jgi:hypothetical protein
MWSKIGSFVVVQIVLPLLRDLAFMLMNMFKVRQIRKKVDLENKKKALDLINAKTDAEIKEAFENMP